jgi:hypothetical protein
MDDIKDVIRAAREQGWRVEQRSKGTWYFWPPDKSVSPGHFASTPSDVRAFRNFITDMRRKGFIWPWPPSKGR